MDLSRPRLLCRGIGRPPFGCDAQLDRTTLGSDRVAQDGRIALAVQLDAKRASTFINCWWALQ